MNEHVSPDLLSAEARWLAVLDRARARHLGQMSVTGPDLDLQALFVTLTRADVAYVVIGGAAMRLHGSPRVTTDLDICYARSRPNCRALARVLHMLEAHFREPTDVALGPLDETRLARASSVFFLLQTRFGKLDVLPVPNGTTGYDDLIEHAEEFTFDDGVSVLVASRDDLKRMKQATGREVDAWDMRWLENHPKSQSQGDTP